MNLIKGLDKGEAGRSFNINYGLTWPTDLYDYTYVPRDIDNISSNVIKFRLRILFIILFFALFA